MLLVFTANVVQCVVMEPSDHSKFPEGRFFKRSNHKMTESRDFLVCILKKSPEVNGNI